MHEVHRIAAQHLGRYRREIDDAAGDPAVVGEGELFAVKLDEGCVEGRVREVGRFGDGDEAGDKAGGGRTVGEERIERLEGGVGFDYGEALGVVSCMVVSADGSE